MATIASPSPRGRSWRVLARRVAQEVFGVALALATATSLFPVGSAFSRNPFTWKELAVLVAVAWCMVASWGFYHFLADILRPDGFPSRHPGHVAWWLVGGVWVSAAAIDVVVVSSGHESDAVFGTAKIGTLLALPLIVALLAMFLCRRDRVRADWSACAGMLISR